MVAQAKHVLASGCLCLFLIACERPEATPPLRQLEVSQTVDASAAPLSFAPSSEVQCGSPSGMPRVMQRMLSTTDGKIGTLPSGSLSIRAPEVRAVAPGSDSDAAEIRFFYRGPSEKTSLLASGELRRQIGLKLRAQDGCNLVYVMWHIEPTEGIVVAVKSNPGLHTSAECGDRGYHTLVPNYRGRVPKLLIGEPHVLNATIVAETLVVTIDEEQAWRGVIGSLATMRGPVGVRTDNGEFDVDLFAKQFDANR